MRHTNAETNIRTAKEKAAQRLAHTLTDHVPCNIARRNHGKFNGGGTVHFSPRNLLQYDVRHENFHTLCTTSVVLRATTQFRNSER